MRRLVVLLFFLFAAMSLIGCTKFDALNSLVPSGSAIRTLNVPYGHEPRQVLDVYQPRDVAVPAPVIVFFYGGDWYNGSKRDYRFVAQALTSRGFVAVLPDYRLYPQVQFPAYVEDGAAAVRWTRDHITTHGGDPKRIYLMSHSAGSQIAALLTLDAHYLAEQGLPTDTIRATAVLSGPYDFEPTGIHRPVFGMSDTNTVVPPAINAVNFARADAPPMLLIHGEKDRTVDPANTTKLEMRLKRVCAPVEVIRYKDRGHADVAVSLAFPLRWLSPVLEDTTSFFRRHP